MPKTRRFCWSDMESYRVCCAQRSKQARREGLHVGLFRPITVWPFPAIALQQAAARAHKVLVVELSNGQMVEDVRLALEWQRAGGVLRTNRWKRAIGRRDSWPKSAGMHGFAGVGETDSWRTNRKHQAHDEHPERLSDRAREVGGVLRRYERKSRIAASDALLPGMRTRRRAQADR